MSGNQKMIIWILAILVVAGIVVFTVNSCNSNSDVKQATDLIKQFVPK